MAAAEEGEGRLALQGPSAGFRQIDAGVLVDDGAVGADLDAADRIRHVDHAVERDLPGELDVQPGQGLDRVHRAGEAAVEERDVDRLRRPALDVAFLIGAVRDVDDEVAGKLIATALVWSCETCRRILTSFRLPRIVLGRAADAALALTGVRTDDEDVEAAGDLADLRGADPRSRHTAGRSSR